jgi:hypothetical protein
MGCEGAPYPVILNYVVIFTQLRLVECLDIVDRCLCDPVGLLLCLGWGGLQSLGACGRCFRTLCSFGDCRPTYDLVHKPVLPPRPGAGPDLTRSMLV